MSEPESPPKPPKKFIKRCTVYDPHEGRYLFQEDRKYLTRRRLEKSHWYSTNQSNDKYVPYYDLKYTQFTTSPPMNLPPHPRERHRCDFHMSDVINSFFDRKASIWGCTIQLLKCLESDIGKEPERLREEYFVGS